MAQPEENHVATYEELAELETEFHDIDTEIIAQQHFLSRAAYAKRKALIGRIADFWPLVFEQAPREIDQFVQPSDSAVLAAHLSALDFDRFELATADASNADANTAAPPPSRGEPRSFVLRFEFRENKYFEDAVLEKYFWYRHTKAGWAGYVSEPVRIAWKKGMDLTQGMTDAAVAFWEAQKKLAPGAPSESAAYAAFLAKQEQMPEYRRLAKMVEESVEGSLSFFTWFAYRGRHVSAAQNEEAVRFLKEKRAKAALDDEVQESAESLELEEQIDEAESGEATEVFPSGAELAIAIADDLWPFAIKYFTSAQEDTMDEDSEEMEDDEDEEEEEDEDAPVDIRSLVKGRGANGEGPSKKRRTEG